MAKNRIPTVPPSFVFASFRTSFEWLDLFLGGWGAHGTFWTTLIAVARFVAKRPRAGQCIEASTLCFNTTAVGADFFANRLNVENFHFHATYEDLSAFINEQKINQSTLLIKGSRGMALERTLDLF